MKRLSMHALAVTVLGALVSTGCSGTPMASAPRKVPAGDAMSAMGDMSGGFTEGALYVAELHPLNPGLQNKLDPDRRTPPGVALLRPHPRATRR